MRTLGIDLSSQPQDTAACLITWRRGVATAEPPELRCTDARLDALIARADVIGIDAPFGWPEAFVAAVAGWASPEWTLELRDALRLRETDREVHRLTRLTPLSVSTDRIALPAMRAMALLQRHGVRDRSGDGRFFEVYPAGSLRRWGCDGRGYKGREASAGAARRLLLAGLREALPTLRAPDDYAASDHAFDALVAALTARAAGQGGTIPPARDQRATARGEGWIHLPAGPLA